MPPVLEVTTSPDADDIAALTEGLAQFNISAVGPSGREALAVIVRDGDTMLAGLAGYTAWGWLFVQQLWVAESTRSQGWAQRMLNAAESEAIRRGCHGAYIDTFNPVALKAYQRAGYTEFGRLPDFPQGRDRVWLKKKISS